MTTQESTIPSVTVDQTLLARVVCAALELDAVEVEQYQVKRADASRGAATEGVYRVSGTARHNDMRREWAVILKVIRPAASAFNPAVLEMEHPLYWKREALAYQSGLLAELPGGVTAPRCFAIEEHPDGSCWLWLEKVYEDSNACWPLAQYYNTAAALGRFNGAYLAGRPIPTLPWLGPPGALRGALQAFAFVKATVQNEETWRHPLLRAAFPVPIAGRLLNLWEASGTLLDALDRMPRTLCHKDAFRRNIFATRSMDDQSRLTLIDWAYLGIGEMGLDIADLFGASYSTFGVETTDLRALDAAIFDGYLAGLRDVGWHGDPQLVRFGFAASAALKYGCLLLWLGDLTDKVRSAAWEELSGQPINIFVQHQAPLVLYLLDLADEAHNLLRAL